MITAPFRIKPADINTQDLGNLNCSLRASNNADPIKLLQITITPTMLNNVITTPIFLLPSPGTNSYYQIISSSMTLNFNGSAYVQVNSGSELFYGNSNSGVAVNGAFSNLSGVLTNTSNTLSTTTPTSLNQVNLNNVKNMPLYIVSSTSGSGWSSGNSNFTYNIIYSINHL